MIQTVHKHIVTCAADASDENAMIITVFVLTDGLRMCTVLKRGMKCRKYFTKTNQFDLLLQIKGQEQINNEV